ncbi:tetratricopeptide repeat protein [Phaeodactylibacter xiamenensis]|jgi:TolA-binding protein|uniref:tetratricopeptide repeat protein n=1 Tax=Phaeodactylibacter xiamenensis TaxID=1524460 RepID=UPI0024A83925|nr:tetratricopeptide repeat protein [Phaeodactylibacter xiamenensis]
MARRKRNQKQSDETLVDIVEVRDQAQGFMDANQNYIFGGLVALVLIVGGFLAYKNFYQKPKQQEAVEQMFRAQQRFEQDSFALALTNPGGGYMGFLDVIDNYGGTDAGNMAKYYAGVSYLHLGKYEAALDYLKDYSPAGEVTPVMKHGALGDAYSELGDFDAAMKQYKKAVSAGDNEVLTPYYLKKIGMLHERNGNMADARASYERIKEEYPGSPVSRDIEKYIVRASQG